MKEAPWASLICNLNLLIFISHSCQPHTKKAGITGKYGTRYGGTLRKVIKKMEITQHSKYNCVFCGKDT